MNVGTQGKNKSKSLYHKCYVDKERIEDGEKYLLTGKRGGTLCEFHGKKYIMDEISELIEIYNELSSSDTIKITLKKKGKIK